MICLATTFPLEIDWGVKGQHIDVAKKTEAEVYARGGDLLVTAELTSDLMVTSQPIGLLASDLQI